MKYPEQFKIINSNFVRRLSDGAEISVESAYYQSWLADGNAPEPADPSPPPDYSALRAAAYRDEADPLFFKAQRGEATMNEWLAKIEEIKTRWPATSG
ncbi:MAG: hypothetical protein ACRCTO_07330 [Pseudomonas paracarnis]